MTHSARPDDYLDVNPIHAAGRSEALFPVIFVTRTRKWPARMAWAKRSRHMRPGGVQQWSCRSAFLPRRARTKNTPVSPSTSSGIGGSAPERRPVIELFEMHHGRPSRSDQSPGRLFDKLRRVRAPRRQHEAPPSTGVEHGASKGETRP